jgi:hypothetical protein
MTVLDLGYNFASLSVRDLLDARDTYHYHLLSKPNVIGTAIGLYLIRKDEDWPQRKGEGKNPPNKKSYPRTLANSEVRDSSKIAGGRTRIAALQQRQGDCPSDAAAHGQDCRYPQANGHSR